MTKAHEHRPLENGPLLATLFVTAMGWALGFVLMKVIAHDVDPFTIAMLRGLVATAALTVWFLATKRSILPRGLELVHWCVLGSLTGWIPNVLTGYALTGIGAGLAAMIQTMTPLLVAIAAHLVFHDDRMTPLRIGGLVSGFVGVGILVGPRLFEGPAAGVLPVLAMFGCSACYTTGNLYARRVSTGDPARLAFGQQLCSGGIATGLAFAFGGGAPLDQAIPVWPYVLGLGLIATALPITLFMRMIARAGAVRASMVGYLVPVLTPALSFFLLGETLGLREMLGGAIVLASIFVVTHKPKRREAGA